MTKIFLLILVAGFALCGSTTDNAVSKSSEPIDATNTDDAKKAAQTVETFMDLIAAGENGKAKSLMFDPKANRKYEDLSTAPQDPSAAPRQTYEEGSTLDWVSVLAERKYRLVKILSESAKGDIAEVETDLNIEDLKSIIQKAVFELKKVDDEWRIADVDLVDKYAPPRPKLNGV
jgi:hypothetical protein